MVNTTGTELLAPSSDAEEAWRGAMRCVPRLFACAAAFSGGDALACGEYAITGGLGGLGLRAAAMLAKSGVTHVALSSRGGRVVRDGQGLDVQLASLHAVAQLVTGDASDALDAHSLLAHGTLSGVLHAAGVLRDKTLRAMPRDELDRVFAPKAIAASHVVVAVANCLLYTSPSPRDS